MDSMKFMPHCVSRSIIFAAGLALPLSGGEVPAGKPTVFTEHLLKDGYSYSYGLAAADLDGDGDIDLTSSDTRNFKLYWFENDGRGGFKEHFIEDGDRLGVSGSITGDAIGRSSDVAIVDVDVYMTTLRHEMISIRSPGANFRTDGSRPRGSNATRSRM